MEIFISAEPSVLFINSAITLDIGGFADIVFPGESREGFALPDGGTPEIQLVGGRVGKRRLPWRSFNKAQYDYERANL